MKKLTQLFAAKFASRVGFTLLAAALTAFQPCASAAAAEPGRADFKDAAPSDEARQLADWVLDSNNNRRLPFLIVDKKAAMVFAFHADGLLRGAAPVLLGMAVGDDSVPGIGQRKLSTIRPEERTTPAGRFVAALDRNLHGADILWIDYDAAISLHRVVTTSPQERRAERLASPSPLDNRISYGCINVPVKFFDHVVKPAFKGNKDNKGIVYVLPETRSAREVFGSYDVAQHHAGTATAPQPN